MTAKVAPIKATITAAQASQVAAALRMAMKPLLGCDKKMIVDQVVVHNRANLTLIREAYKKDIGRDLIKDLRDKLGGDLESAVISIVQDIHEFDAYQIQKACKGMGTDEALINEILCTRSYEDIVGIRQAFQAMFKKDMVTVLESEASGNLLKIWSLLCMRSADQPMGNIDAMVAQDIEALYKAGEGKMGTDEGVFIRKLCVMPREYNERLYHEYAKKYGKALDSVIKSEMSGNMSQALEYLVTPLPILFAKLINKAVSGMGTKEQLLVRVVGMQKERHLGAACEVYLHTYKKTGFAAVKDDTSYGEFQTILLETIRLECERYEKVQAGRV